MNQMKYLIIGTGGTGGAIGASLAKAGKDVSFIARGAHLDAIRENGLRIERPSGVDTIRPAKAFTMEEYTDTPDVIFVCVKGYSIPDAIPFIKRVAGEETVVIPILNVYGTGERMQEALPELLVLDGCIYVAAHVSEPGCIHLSGDILRVVFGVRDQSDFRPVLKQVRSDLIEGRAAAVLSKDIKRDTMVKYSYIAAQNTCGVYYDIPAGPIQTPGEQRDCFEALSAEIQKLGEAMGIVFKEDLAERNLNIIDSLAPDMMTSMQRDLKAGKQTEIDGLIYAVPEMAKKAGITLPLFEEITAKIRARG